MRPVIAFRTLIVAQWLVPLLLIGLELAMPIPTAVDSLGPALADVASNTETSEPMSLKDASQVLFLTLLATVSVGLWRFRRWAPTAYWVVLGVYATVVAFDTAPSEGVGQLITWLDGLMAGAVAAWVAVARDTLPFPSDESRTAG